MSINTQRAAIALRTIIVGSVSNPGGDNLVGLKTRLLPDGAEAYITQSQFTYRLNKASTQVASSPTFVAPVEGPGIWELQGLEGAAYLSSAINGSSGFSSAAGQAVVVNTWHALASGDTFYVQSIFSTFWTLNATTGVLTYSGPTGKLFLITADFTASCATNLQELDVELTLNGALVGTTTSSQTSAQVAMGVAASPSAVTHQRMLSAINGVTYQHVFRNVTATPGDVQVARYNVSIVCLGTAAV